MNDFSSPVRITLIFSLFAVVHSLSVTRLAKQLAVRICGEQQVKGGYRLIFTIISLLSFSAAIFLIRSMADVTLAVLPFGIRVIFIMLQISGCCIIALAVRNINISEFLGIAQFISYLRRGSVGGDIEGLRSEALITHGIYRITRHPLYLGSMLVVTFNTQVTLNNLTFLVLADIYFIIGAWLEEKRLGDRFGLDYAIYRERTGMIFPSPGKLLLPSEDKLV